MQSVTTDDMQQRASQTLRQLSSTATSVYWTIFGVALAIGAAMLIPGAVMLKKYNSANGQKAANAKSNLGGGIVLVVLGCLFILGSVIPLIAAVAIMSLSSAATFADESGSVSPQQP